MRFLSDNYITMDATQISASTENLNFPLSNLKNPLRSKYFRTTSPDDQSIVFDLITTEDINSVVILFPKENGIKLTNAVNIRIQANATNNWTSPAVDQVLSIDNNYEVISHFFTSNQSYRYWRLFVDDPTNPYGYIEIGMVWIGLSENIQNAQNGFKWVYTDLTKVDKTPFNHRYYDRYPKVTSLEFDYQFLDESQIQVLEDIFRRNGTSEPVLIVLDESEVVFDKDRFLIYGNMNNQFGMSHVRYDIFNQDGMRVEELS